MRKNTGRALGFDTIKLEGSLFIADLLEKAALGKADKQEASDYRIPRGLRLLDEYGRFFQIALAVYKQFEASHDSKALAVELFRDALGYADIVGSAPVALGDKSYPISLMATRAVPVVVAPAGIGLEEPMELFAVGGSGYHKGSAFSLAQEFLNTNADCDWALVTNGAKLRLLRSSASLARPSYLEFDLEAILSESGRYPDFCAFWRIVHASRAESREGLSIWEYWRVKGQEQGQRVRDGLLPSVTTALTLLGEGFLRFEGEGNEKLRVALLDGDLSPAQYFNELLRLVYRFLFLFTIEERGLIHAGPVNAENVQARSLYQKGYALSRLRDRALRQSGFDEEGDQWKGIGVLFRCLDKGEPRLDLSALGGLFSAEQCLHLDDAGLSNRSLLSAMRCLRWMVSGNARTMVDYRNMGFEELGSVYEGLLELVPDIDLASRSFGFVGIDTEGSTAGNARKTSGSYYTPDSLVQELVKSALDPVIEAKLASNPAEQVKALLEFSVIDPSCGSGHFLIAAARHLAECLAKARSQEGAVKSSDYTAALREVIGHSIYGVDLNPMAVELCRMALWLEGYEPGKPLSFLDHHVRCGNSLVGVMNLDALKEGIPDEAYAALSGDDKQVAGAFKKRNAKEREAASRKQNRLFEDSTKSAEAAITVLHWKLENIAGDTVEGVERKRAAFKTLLESPQYLGARLAGDLYTAAFFAPKVPGALVPTTEDLDRAASGVTESLDFSGVNALAEKLSTQGRFFHWRLEFPEVFGKGGFDCVLGNPPWDVSQLKEDEFFASRSTKIACLVGDKRKNAIAELQTVDFFLWSQYLVAKREYEAVNVFYRESGRYALTAVGKINTYSLFSELNINLFKIEGRSGFIVPSGIATDDSTKDFFAEITGKERLVFLYSFENEELIFPAVHHAFKFCLLVIGGIGKHQNAKYVFFARRPADLRDERRAFALSALDIELLNPNTRTCAIFRSNADSELTKKIYGRVPVLIREANVRAKRDEENAWRITFKQGLFNMTSDSDLFHASPNPGLLPLYEAKMVHQFDHRWASYEGEDVRDVSDTEKANSNFSVKPRYWVDHREVLSCLAAAPKAVVKAWLAKDETALRDALSSCYDDRELSSLVAANDLLGAIENVLDKRSPRWLLGWRDITLATNERTTIASIIPRMAVGDTFLLMLVNGVNSTIGACLLSDQNCLVHDYIARQKIGGNHLKYHYKKQLPNIPPNDYSLNDLAFIVPRVLELSYTATDLEPWAEDIWSSSDGELRREFLERHEDARTEKLGPGVLTPPFYCPPPQELASRSWSTEILPPFDWLPNRRARIRAELDARYARLYGLTRDELRYILDPADVMGEDYPSETFRVLKESEIRKYGEYRTRRLVLEAWDGEEVIK
jgi:hypothetical protein